MASAREPAYHPGKFNPLTGSSLKILFICTHNRCRSILAEAIANSDGEGLIEARSAGSEPAGEVHPLTIKYLAEHNIPVINLQSESWDKYEDFDPDLVITVCCKAAQEICPVWFGKSRQLHWELEDPSAIVGDEMEIASAFTNTINILKNQIDKLNLQTICMEQN